MFCKNCQKQINKDDLFCIYCGSENKNNEDTTHINNTQKIHMNTIQNTSVSTMNNIQEKVGVTVSKAQSGLEKFKNKAEIMKEKSRLSGIIQDSQAKKAKVLADLGLAVYEKIRYGEIKDSSLDEICSSILGFDYIIYESSTKIEELDKLNKGIACECGTELNGETKFCTGCGKKVEIPVDNRVFTTCKHCEAEIESGVNFCVCCGNRA